MNENQEFHLKVLHILSKINDTESKNIDSAADICVRCVQEGHLIFVFGCGHSHILADDSFFRAGGLACIYPIYIEPLMLHEGAVTSSKLEKKSGYISNYFDSIPFCEGDVLIIISTSGRNPVPIELAIFAKSKGVKIICISSLEYPLNCSSRHESNKFLSEFADITIDNHSPFGDSIGIDKKTRLSFTSPSTITGAYIIQNIYYLTIENLLKKGFNPPVFLSGNVDNSASHNQELIDTYASIIPYLK